MKRTFLLQTFLRFQFPAQPGQMFAILRTLKSEDRSSNPTFPWCKYGQIKAGFALQSQQPSVICRFSHHLKHSSVQKPLVPSPDRWLHLGKPPKWLKVFCSWNISIAMVYCSHCRKGKCKLVCTSCPELH